MPLEHTVKLETENPVENIHCPICSRMSKTTKLVKKTYITFLMIPLFCVKTSAPYIGCDKCKYGLGMEDVMICDNCRNVIIDDADRFCSRCGFKVREELGSGVKR
ncbi:hypothetical protein THOM_2438 [Trachipleistophora hominis]|uniref:Zinc-ribbon 15 domain-containing protein n=1 Tax=Trachipleistophora hominis TaxID=72359 RepID=L7JV87_TRAHO|nr:hypothetical protein THOM_2438 [Trachipleistophora hominis]